MLKVIDIKNKESKPIKNKELTDEDLVIKIADFVINFSVFNSRAGISLNYDELLDYSRRLLNKINYEGNKKIPDEVLKESLASLDFVSYIRFDESNPAYLLKEAVRRVCGNLDFETALKLVELRVSEKIQNQDPVLGQSLYKIYLDRINK